MAKAGIKVFNEEHTRFMMELDYKFYSHQEAYEYFINEFTNDNITLNEFKNRFHALKLNLKKKTSDDEILKLVKETSECTLISIDRVKDNKSRIKLNLICKCGETFIVDYSKFQDKNRNKKQCNKCSRKNFGDTRRFTHEAVIEKIKEINPNIECLSQYTLTMNYADFKCKICGHEWNTLWNSILARHGCDKCDDKRSSERQKYTYYKIVEILPKYNNTIELLTKEINGIHQVLEWKCLKCGKIFYKNWNNVRCGQDCTHCSFVISKGEDKIEEILTKCNIKYRKQKTFNDCVSLTGKKLRYDFYIKSHNICIEYDGEQHFRPVAFDGKHEKAEARFEKTKIHDAIKNNYCVSNNIDILRIGYFDYNNIEDILLKSLNITKEETVEGENENEILRNIS